MKVLYNLPKHLIVLYMITFRCSSFIELIQIMNTMISLVFTSASLWSRSHWFSYRMSQCTHYSGCLFEVLILVLCSTPLASFSSSLGVANNNDKSVSLIILFIVSTILRDIGKLLLSV